MIERARPASSPACCSTGIASRSSSAICSCVVVGSACRRRSHRVVTASAATPGSPWALPDSTASVRTRSAPSQSPDWSSARPSSGSSLRRLLGSAATRPAARSSRFAQAGMSPWLRARCAADSSNSAARSPRASISVSVAPSSTRKRIRALQVVHEDLVQLHERGAVLLEPSGEALVQVRARGLRQGVVGRV